MPRARLPENVLVKSLKCLNLGKRVTLRPGLIQEVLAILHSMC